MTSDTGNLNITSLLVPAYGFDGDEAAAEEYFRRASHHRLGRYRPAIIRNEYNGKIYVTLPGEWRDLGTDMLQVRTVGFDRPLWVPLRNKEEPKPGYLVCLLLEGGLEYYKDVRGNRLPAWVQDLSGGNRDCLARWLKHDGSLFPVVAQAAFGQNRVAICAARSGHGAVYARTAVLDQRGQIANYSVLRANIAFSILDKHPDKGDMLKVEIRRSMSWEQPDDTPRVDGHELDDHWKSLMGFAQQDFFKHCDCLPAEVEQERRFFLDQIAKSEADRAKPFGQSFRELAESVSWQDALRLVEEPWQMEVVCYAHGRRPEFSSDGGIYTIPYETVPAMIRGHECTDERRRALQDMVDGFVAPRDSHWNYRGD